MEGGEPALRCYFPTPERPSMGPNWSAAVPIGTTENRPLHRFIVNYRTNVLPPRGPNALR